MSNLAYDLDRAVAAASQALASQHNPVPHAFASAGNWWGGPGVIWFAAVVWLGGRALKRLPLSLLGLRGAEAIAVASAISGIVKGIAGRARPFVTPGEPWHWNLLHGWGDAHYYSMPSGHTTASIAFAAAIAVASAQWPRASRVTMTLAAFTAVVVVGFARIYSNQHWFSDVIAGAILGATTGLLIARWHERHPRTAFDRALAGTER